MRFEFLKSYKTAKLAKYNLGNASDEVQLFVT